VYCASWRALMIIILNMPISAEFAQHVLKQTAASSSALLDPSQLSQGHVLELG
jgi:hypothetical protein